VFLCVWILILGIARAYPQWVIVAGLWIWAGFFAYVWNDFLQVRQVFKKLNRWSVDHKGHTLIVAYVVLIGVSVAIIVLAPRLLGT